MSNNAALHSIAEGIWAFSHEVPLMPGVKLPTRGLVFRLSSGKLALMNPVKMSAVTVSAINELGSVSAIVAPNLWHHMYFGRAGAAFPGAELLAVPGLSKKQPNLSFQETITRALPKALADDFEAVPILGAPIADEVVFLHRPTKSLVVTDYFFNIQDARGILSPLVLRMMGAYKRPAQSKLWRRITKDKAAMQASAREVLNLQFERVIPSHGENIDEGNRFAERELSWLLA